MIIRFRLLIFVLLFVQSLLAQTSLSGRVTDDKNEGVYFATVALYQKPDSTLVNAVSTDDNGFFEITGIKAGNYFLEASMLSYNTATVPELVFPQDQGKKLALLLSENTAQIIDEQTIKELKAMLRTDKKSFKQRFTVKKKDGIKLIDTKEISYFEANGDFCMAIDATGKKHLINHSMMEVEKKVDPDKFFRINRSQIINIDYVENIDAYFKNKLAIKMAQSKELLLTSSTKTAEFRKWIEG